MNSVSTTNTPSLEQQQNRLPRGRRDRPVQAPLPSVVSHTRVPDSSNTSRARTMPSRGAGRHDSAVTVIQSPTPSSPSVPCNVRTLDVYSPLQSSTTPSRNDGHDAPPPYTSTIMLATASRPVYHTPRPDDLVCLPGNHHSYYVVTRGQQVGIFFDWYVSRFMVPYCTT
jgi:hypothetical protein